jgi:hypothetical protein
MAARRISDKRGKLAGRASWLALIAATSLGGLQAETLRTQIKAPADAVSAGRRYRLVVQSYDQDVGAAIPDTLRPRGSTQRAVTADDLVRGIQVDLVELSATGLRDAAGASTVVAWFEPGEADLELDARRARPKPGSFFGVATLRERGAQLYLDQRLRQG